MGTIMDWLRAHGLSKRPVELPREIREASHRQAAESSKLRAEVMIAAGGAGPYYRKAQEINDLAMMLRGEPRKH